MTVEAKCAAWDVVADRQAAEGYVARVCFKTGPPHRLGVELEWTVHHENDPNAAIAATDLRAALCAHAPFTLDPDGPHLPLDHGGVVTVEPGGQVEISTPAFGSLSRLLRDTSRVDIGQTLRRAAARWDALHAIGPALIALLANSLALVELACKALPDTGLSPDAIHGLTCRLRAKAGGDHD